MLLFYCLKYYSMQYFEKDVHCFENACKLDDFFFRLYMYFNNHEINNLQTNMVCYIKFRVIDIHNKRSPTLLILY